MSAASNLYGMSSSELSVFLAEQRENGFQALPQDKRLFGLTFVETGSYVQASEAAGVQRETGKRWLRDPLVSCFINYLNQRKEHYSLIDASFVESQYLALFAKLVGEDEVEIIDKDGNQLSRRKFHASEAVAALRDMAKISGHYKEDNSISIKIEAALSEEQKKLLDKALDDQY